MLELHRLMRDYSKWLLQDLPTGAGFPTDMTRKLAAIFFLLAFCVLSAPAQRRGERYPPPFPAPECRPDDRICLEQKAAREKALNRQRQADIKKDTDKLLQLATELKDAVDKTNENMLSLDVIRKTDEIEKLAKEVRKKMKDD
jgi:hypothetical protein